MIQIPKTKKAKWRVAGDMFRFATIFCILFSIGTYADDFPVPQSLESNVAFWKRVYSEWTTNQIAFSDEEDLGLVYAVIDVPDDKHPAARAEKIKQTKNELRAALDTLEALRPQSETQLTGLAQTVFLALKDNPRQDKYRRGDFIRAQNGLKDRFEQGYYMAGAHETEIRTRFREAGLPEDLIAIAFVESLFHPKAKSWAGACGIWQFLKGTAREYLSVNKLVDERFDPILATKAAIEYIKSAREALVEWPLVITSYNYGRAGMARAVDAVNSRDFDVILKKYNGDRFGFAARNYYAEFLAALAIYRDAKEYLPDAEQASPWSYDVLTLANPAFLRDLTMHDHELSQSLAQLNPALTPEVVRGKEVLPTGFRLRVPKGERKQLIAKMNACPKAERRRAQQAVRARHRSNGRQTLAQIAGIYDVSDDQLSERMGIDPKKKLRRGTVVNIRSAESRFTPLPDPIYKPKAGLQPAADAQASLSQDG